MLLELFYWQRFNSSLQFEYFLNQNFEKENTIIFNNEILDITTFREYNILTTKNEIILLKNNAIVKGTPLKYDGKFTVSKLSENDKINILLTRNKILYNYELE